MIYDKFLRHSTFDKMATITDRPVQITVFGATGFTGNYVAEDLKTRNIKGLTWAVAGRNKAKLEKVLNGK